MTVEILINPDLDEVRPALIEALNACFTDWGGETDFHWHFVRTVGGRKADMMIVRDNGRFVAGSAVVYRPVRFGDGERAEVGIMASSWTLPEARGQGHFTRIIDASMRLAKDNGAALLLAYVTSINASSRRLLASGADGYPTHYLIGDGSPPPAQVPRVEIEELSADAIDDVRRTTPAPAGASHFIYSPEEWRGQFWIRPYDMHVLRVGPLGTALIETKNDFDRLIAFSCATDDAATGLASLIAWSHAHGRKLFFFTTETSWKDRAVELGLRHLPGYLTAHRLDPASTQVIDPWYIQSGDRM